MVFHTDVKETLFIYLFIYLFISPSLLPFLSVKQKCAKARALLLAQRQIYGVEKRSTSPPTLFSCHLGAAGSSVNEVAALQLSHTSFSRSRHKNRL
jgi:hypothetical protein